MSLLSLYLIFFKIGCCVFGGGYAMIPLFMDELVTKHALMNEQEFADVIALAQMTPGPVGLNAATYVGQLQGGFVGATVATLGVLTPSLVLGFVLAYCLKAFSQNRHWQAVLSGVRPATLGLIAASVIFFAETSLFTSKLSALWKAGESFGISWQGMVIFAAAILAQSLWKIKFIWILMGGAVLGWLLNLF